MFNRTLGTPSVYAYIRPYARISIYLFVLIQPPKLTFSHTSPSDRKLGPLIDRQEGLADGRTDRFFPILQNFVLYRGRCPAFNKRTKKEQ